MSDLNEDLPKFRKTTDTLYHGGIPGADGKRVSYRLMKSAVGGGYFAYVADSKGWRLIEQAALFDDARILCVKHSTGELKASHEKTYTNFHGLEETIKNW
jgi:hypothetical protein